MTSQVVLISGGTRGIGKSLVDLYLAQGHKVATFGQSVDNVNSLRELHPNDDNLLLEKVDINNPKDVEDFVDQVVAKFSYIDVLYLNAGIYADSTFLKMKKEQWDKVIETNLKSIFTLSQKVFKKMAETDGEKRIYLMTSLAGISGSFGQVNYSASKAGMIGFAKALALEGKKFNISVNAISPAALTDMTRPIIEKIEAKCELENKPFPDYWKIGTSDELAKTLIKLDGKLQGMTGRIFGINGENVVLYEEPKCEKFDI